MAPPYHHYIIIMNLRERSVVRVLARGEGTNSPRLNDSIAVSEVRQFDCHSGLPSKVVTTDLKNMVDYNEEALNAFEKATTKTRYTLQDFRGEKRLKHKISSCSSIYCRL
jgi:hypothetical protein